MDHNNIIELNGKRYDAVTGKYLGKSRATPIPVAPARPAAKVVDDFVRSTARPSTTVKHSSASHKRAHQVKPAHRTAPKHTAPHRPEHAKTLMRHAVSKPQLDIQKPSKKKRDLTAAPVQTLAIKQSVANVDPWREHRAKQTPRHRQVQRFSAARQTTAVLPRANYNTRPATATTHATAPLLAQQKPSQQQPQDIFEAAIAHATSHKQPTPRVARQRSRRARLARAATVVAVALVLGGFAAWTQRSYIELKVASWQAGFRANVPSYAPVGYEHGPIRTQHGQVVVTFQSGANQYRITQQSSDWNSQTLHDQAVAADTTKELQTVESKGRVIYIYGNSASWVDGGVRYDITGNAPLNKTDILAIVDSI